MAIHRIRRIENKTVRQFVEEIQTKIDCEVLGVNQKNHYVLRLPRGEKVILSGTPSDHRAMLVSRTKIRRLGYDI